ncbi:unnamed protein product [Clavelina lepadiformis]|uniref:Uncharacterized protein n=1 Tax=Clavelina lepadiformis TaxID=159417 RepID=A0ABP0GCN2_CLALP
MWNVLTAVVRTNERLDFSRRVCFFADAKSWSGADGMLLLGNEREIKVALSRRTQAGVIPVRMGKLCNDVGGRLSSHWALLLFATIESTFPTRGRWIAPCWKIFSVNLGLDPQFQSGEVTKAQTKHVILLPPDIWEENRKTKSPKF